MIFHLILHFLVPLLVALIFFRGNLKAAYLIMIATMVVDVDHLLASPIYDPARCSIGFHPLHSIPAILFYFLISLIPKLRIIGIGLLIHMALDGIDCLI